MASLTGRCILCMHPSDIFKGAMVVLLVMLWAGDITIIEHRTPFAQIYA